MTEPREYDFTKRMKKQWERIQELGLDKDRGPLTEERKIERPRRETK